MIRRRSLCVVAVIALVFGWTGNGRAQGKVLTDAVYARAEKFMGYNVNPLVYHTVHSVHWLDDGRFWYFDRDASGVTYMVVDPAKKTREPAFDHAKLAAALTEAAAGRTFDPHHLEITELKLSDGDREVDVTIREVTMYCDLSGKGKCTAEEHKGGPEPGTLSPDGKKAAFIRDWNLWVRDVTTGKETQLTTDGVENFGYATDNAGWKRTDSAIVAWSPDSKKIATFQQDERKVGNMYLVPVTNGHSDLVTWKYPLAGDKNVAMIERVIIDVGQRKVVRLEMPADFHRSTICDDVSCEDTTWDDVEWGPDSKTLAFASTSRDHKQVWLRVADAATGDVRTVYTETAPKFFESGNGKVNWKYLPGSNEFLWFSERSNWGQMYLYDLTTGKLKNQITHGEGNVSQMLYVDPKARVLYFVGVGKETGRDPYFEHYYSVRFDGTDQKLLTPEDADHDITPSPDGRYFADVYSTPTEPQTAVVRGNDGALDMDVTKQDITTLVAAGWKPLTPITVKARDGKTDLYGYMFKPTDFDPARKYPIINYIYPGPWSSSCGSRHFSAAHVDDQALAELGFVVVCIDGMGTPSRSKAFHEFYYGNLGDDTIPDQIAGMKQLAARYPWIDLDRAGIWGHSGGGYATASAMFHFPDFFKVGISESGNHDNRDYEDDWAEKWSGLVVTNPNGTSNYDSQANQSFAKNLKGHLLLAHGTMDDNVPMNNTLLVVDALIKANKDFDLILLPNQRHGYGPDSQYMMRRRWDYFVRYLAGDTPPHEYEMKPWNDVLEIYAQNP
ncbi:dipeptidyl peptidase IV [Edaphobacter acidisoli]|uniref:Dipeptidyl peptidase IV n=1 Tax=Edaphobacter acidisoli TaxID=2040573 RepID=A0A916RYG2_9BACT|nr:S9 family peptidase [Edaphobacter acidisoli]GGA72935.1 dipeptidyl peptidase IV [Edaphobacter acidisoli]